MVWLAYLLNIRESAPVVGCVWKSDLMRIRVLSLVFLSGVVGMAIEMCAARLLAPYFGTSQVVWANLIGLILLYLSVGYFLGGWLADRYPTERALALLMLFAALSMALIPFISGPFLQRGVIGLNQANVSILAGSLESVLLLFLVPVTLLGMVPPFAIRLTMTELQKAGSSSGGIYMLSTLGSILGTFLPVFWLIPTIGTAQLSGFCGAALPGFGLEQAFARQVLAALGSGGSAACGADRGAGWAGAGAACAHGCGDCRAAGTDQVHPGHDL